MFALSFGFNYGVDNHPVYLLQALRLLKPEILKHDWYAAEAMQYHPVFSYIAAPLIRISPAGWGIGLALTVCITVGTAAWFSVLKRLSKSPLLALAAFGALVALMHATQTLSIAVSYIFNQAFQPSTLGSVGLIFALCAFAAGRWLWSGALLAFSGLFHANYLVLNVAVFGLVHLLLGGDLRQIARRLLLQLGPSVVPLAVLAMPMLATIGGGNAAEAQRILFQIRAPHHYFPRSFDQDLVLTLGWFALGMASSAALPSSRALNLLRRWMIACSIVVLVPTLLTSWSYVPRIAQLFVWRLAPFLDLVGQTLFCLALVRCARTPRAWRALQTAHWGTLFTALLALASAYALRDERAVTEVLLALVGVGALAVFLPTLVARFALFRFGGARFGALAPKLLWAVCACTLAIACWHPWPEVAALRQRSNLLTGMPQVERDLYSWVKANTPLEARFLIPPQEPSFRYFAERPIIVDWKSTPMLPADVIEWYRRMKAVTARPSFASHRDMEGFRTLSSARVRSLKTEFGVDYLVTYAGTRSGDGFKLVHRNARYDVYDLR